MTTTLWLLVSVAVVGICARPQVDRQYLPPGQDGGQNGYNRGGQNGYNVGGQQPSSQYSAPSSQYGAPSNQYSGRGSSGSSPSSQYGAPSNQYAGRGGSNRFTAASGNQNGGSFNGYEASRGGPNGQDDPLAEPANYEFSYEVQDDESGNNFGHRESRQGDEARGSYHVLLPDGRTQIVDYVANDEGYTPVIRYEEAQGGQGGYPSGPNGGRGGYSSGPRGGQGGYSGSGSRGGQGGYSGSRGGQGGYSGSGSRGAEGPY